VVLLFVADSPGISFDISNTDEVAKHPNVQKRTKYPRIQKNQLSKHPEKPNCPKILKNQQLSPYPGRKH
jgi:hypothetical protein